MKIFISIFRLYKIGGIESSLINLINEINDSHDITLCVLTDVINSEFILPQVNIIRGSRTLRDSFIARDSLKQQSIVEKLIRNFRRLIKRMLGSFFVINCNLKKIKIDDEYDVAIAFINDTYTSNGQFKSGGDYDFVSRYIKAKKKIAWIHGDPYQEGLTYEICKTVFSPFDSIINVSYSCKDQFDKIIPNYINKSFVVYNMYNIDRINALSIEYNPYQHYIKRLHFVTVTRIDNKSKRIDRIIKVCNNLIKSGFTNFDWTVVGEGPDFREMNQMVLDKNLSDIIIMKGAEYNPYPYMKYADLYISTSVFESFGMSVREAQILNCPVLITNVRPSNELVDKTLTGIICENSTSGIYNSIVEILKNTDILSNIRNYLNDHPFTNKVSLKQFNALIEK